MPQTEVHENRYFQTRGSIKQKQNKNISQLESKQPSAQDNDQQHKESTIETMMMLKSILPLLLLTAVKGAAHRHRRAEVRSKKKLSFRISSLLVRKLVRI